MPIAWRTDHRLSVAVPAGSPKEVLGPAWEKGYNHPAGALQRQRYWSFAAFDERFVNAVSGSGLAQHPLGEFLDRDRPDEVNILKEFVVRALVARHGGGERVAVMRDRGDERLPGDDGAFDRFVATYVFDLLDDGDARRMLAWEARLLCPGGRLCLVGITPGRGGLSRLVMSAWGAIAVGVPHLVGGCRPIDASQLIDGQRFAPVANEVLTRWAVSSQIVIAQSRS